MTFKHYTDGKSWEECLQIFLFIALVKENTDYRLFSVKSYAAFELTDNHILAYNQWVKDGAIQSNNLLQWIKNNPEDVLAFEKEFSKSFLRKVEIWSDRDKTPYYKEKLQQAFKFEEFLGDFFNTKYGVALGQYLTPAGQYNEGENALGIEIKHDMMYKKTGNLYIEYAEKSKPENPTWVDSGIKKPDNTSYFLIGDFEKFWVFRKARLLEILLEEMRLVADRRPSPRQIRFVTIKTSRGFVYPITHAEKEALQLDILIEEIKKEMPK